MSATNVARVGKRGNICVGNNVSATMCPRLPGLLEVRYLIQGTESLIFTNLEIGIFCVVQETSRHVFNKLPVQKRFRI